MKRIAIVAFVLLLMSISSFATETRTLTMGDNDKILVDDGNIYRFPGRVFNYPNLAFGEFDNADLYDFGINWQFCDDNPMVLGTYFSTDPALTANGFMTEWINNSTFWNYAPDDMTANVFAFSGITQPPNRRIDLYFGKQFSSYNFGAHIGYTTSGWKYDDNEDAGENQTKQKFGYMLFGLGLTEAATGQWDVGLNFGMGSFTDEDFEGKTCSEASGFYDFSLEGRYFWIKDPKITMVPHAALAMGKRGVDAFDVAGEADGWKNEYSRMGFEGGIGMNYTSGPDMLAVLDFGFIYNKIKQELTPLGDNADLWEPSENTYSGMTIPYFKIGFEADVFDWMDVRMGATSYWNSESYEQNYDNAGEAAVEDFSASYACNDTYLGFAFHWGRLHVDAATNPRLFINGFNFVSGSTTTMNTQLTAVYELF